MGEGDWDSLLRQWRKRVLNIHIEDMIQGVHEHLLFGQGTMDFPAIFQALHQIDYQWGLHVELSRHSHMAVNAVQMRRRSLNRSWSSPRNKEIRPPDGPYFLTLLFTMSWLSSSERLTAVHGSDHPVPRWFDWSCTIVILR